MIIALVAVSVFFVTFAYASPPTTPYNANETLDPTCGPTDTNCYVSSSAGVTTAGNGLSVSGSSVEFGGADLNKQTILGLGGNSFTIYDSFSSPSKIYFYMDGNNASLGTDTVSLQIGSAPGPGVLISDNGTGEQYMQLTNSNSFLSNLTESVGVSGGHLSYINIPSNHTYFDVSASAVTAYALKNTDTTKFLQADANGNITNVSLPSGGGSVSAGSGLTNNAGALEVGGLLTHDTYIDPDTYQFAINGNVDANKGWLDVNASQSHFGVVNSSNQITDIFIDDGDIGLALGGSGGTLLFSHSVIANNPVTEFNLEDGTSSFVEFQPHVTKLTALANSDSSKFLQADANGNITNVSVPSGGGGGGSVSTGNGLTNNSGTFELGGALTRDTDIDPSTFKFSINKTYQPSEPLLDLESAFAGIGFVDGSGKSNDIEINTLYTYINRNGQAAMQLNDTDVNFVDSAGPYAALSRSAVTFKALDNSDSTKFLQADANGNITNVSVPSGGGGVTGSGTAGQLTYWDGSTTVAGNTNLIWDNTNTRLGVDTSTLAYTFEVGSSSLVSGIVARFENVDGTCDVNPTLGAGGFTCSSDMRLKKNITRLSDDTAWTLNQNIDVSKSSVLSKVLALAPVSYNWNREQDPSQKHTGFIAQEMREIFPGLVSEDPSSQMLSINYSGLIPYTIEAIQEMDIQVQAIPVLQNKALYTKISDFLRGIAERGVAIIDIVQARDVQTKNIHTNTLCVGTTCVTQEQFLKMVTASNK